MSYKSKGTVRLEGISGRGTSRSWKLFFVPDNDHSVKDGDRYYAVFFDTDDNPFNQGRVVDLDTISREVPITLRSTRRMLLLSQAATAKTKIEIEVDIPSSPSSPPDPPVTVTFIDVASLPAT